MLSKQEASGKDPRFYYVRVIDLKLVKRYFKENTILDLKMQLGSQFSRTALRGVDFPELPLSNPKTTTTAKPKFPEKELKPEQDKKEELEVASLGQESIARGDKAKKEKLISQDNDWAVDQKRRMQGSGQNKGGKTFGRNGDGKEVIEDELRRITDEAHIFKFGGEEFLNIFLNEKEKEDENQDEDNPKNEQRANNKKNRNKNKSKSEEGFSRILLTPLIQYPHIKHTVKAALIALKDSGEPNKPLVATITLEIYFRLDFKAFVDVIPLSASLGLNMVPVGEMRPVVGISCEGKKWVSLDSGGIHPHWSGHFHTCRRDFQSKVVDDISYTRITNVGKNLERNNDSLEERCLYHDENLLKENEGNKESGSDLGKKRQQYFDIARFHLSEAGSQMEIKVYSKPFAKAESPIVGQSTFQIANEGFLRIPTTDGDLGYFSPQVIDLFTKEEEPEFIGKLKVLVRFVFDKENVLNCGPFKEELGKTFKERDEEGKEAN